MTRIHKYPNFSLDCLLLVVMKESNTSRGQWNLTRFIMKGLAPFKCQGLNSTLFISRHNSHRQKNKQQVQTRSFHFFQVLLIYLLLGCVPNFNQSNLDLNNFTLYYKPYAIWTAQCQSAYTTAEIALQALKIHTTQPTADAVFAMSIVIISTNSIMILILGFIKKICGNPKDFEKEKYFSTIFAWAQIVMIDLEIFLLFFTYIAMNSQVGFIGRAKIQYIIDNSCSDDILNYAYLQIQQQQKRYVGLSAFGLAFTVCYMGLQILGNLYAFQKFNLRKADLEKAKNKEIDRYVSN